MWTTLFVILHANYLDHVESSHILFAKLMFLIGGLKVIQKSMQTTFSWVFLFFYFGECFLNEQALLHNRKKKRKW